MPIGAELESGGGASFRVWAPNARELVLVLDGAEMTLDPEPGGYHAAFVAAARRGARYGFRIDDSAQVYPDPASRAQPDGPHGLSEIVDTRFEWSDAAWKGPILRGQVLSEIHIGTFTRQGTWRAAIEKLPLLAEVGISLLEMMPVAEFPGRFGWGYDGVSLFAPSRLYGRPDDLRAFVDAAHRLGLGVILDVVYNHLGPDGNYLTCFSDAYLTDRYPNEWGSALDFDGPRSASVREFVRENAAYWVREFHFDGLRLDATQQMFDASPEHIVAELTRSARAAAGERRILVIAENEPQDSALVRAPEKGGLGLDAIWNDDLHHSCRVALTGRAEAYYSDYRGTARELASAIRHGFLYQGQRSAWQKKRRGYPALGVTHERRVQYLENHDQVANSGGGQRLTTLVESGRLRAITALLLLTPGTPMLFQGQEFGAASPFLFFADHHAELAAKVAEGRREFLLQFPSLAGFRLDPPQAEETFRKSRLDWGARERNPGLLALHRDLIALRRADPVLAAQGCDGLDAAAFPEDVLLVRFHDAGAADRLLIVNLGADVAPGIVPEPLLAPPLGRAWRLVWSSEDARYGGSGIVAPETSEGEWRFPGRAALLLKGG